MRRQHPGCHVCAIGFSAGSNTMTKFMAEVEDAGGLTAAVSVANAFNLEQCEWVFGGLLHALGALLLGLPQVAGLYCLSTNIPRNRSWCTA